MAILIDEIISWIYTRRFYGKRCDVVEENCPCCKAWIEHDELCEFGEAQ